jgi:hypothetical protein
MSYYTLTVEFKVPTYEDEDGAREESERIADKLEELSERFEVEDFDEPVFKYYEED